MEIGDSEYLLASLLLDLVRFSAKFSVLRLCEILENQNEERNPRSGYASLRTLKWTKPTLIKLMKLQTKKQQGGGLWRY